MADLTVDFDAGLFGVRSLADLVVHAAGADTASERGIASARERNLRSLRSGGESALADRRGVKCSGSSTGRETEDLITLLRLIRIGHGQSLGQHGDVLARYAHRSTGQAGRKLRIAA